jgi:hypothetical protein
MGSSSRGFVSCTRHQAIQRASACIRASKSNHRTLVHTDCADPTMAGSVAEPPCANLVWTDLGKYTCDGLACKKHGKVWDFVMQVKGIGTKDSAVWLLSLVDKGEGQERVQVEAAASDGGSVAGNGVAVVQEAAKVETMPLSAIEGLTAREAWLVAVIAQGVAWYLAETFKPLSETGTIEQCMVAKVAMYGGKGGDRCGIEQAREGGEATMYSPKIKAVVYPRISSTAVNGVCGTAVEEMHGTLFLRARGSSYSERILVQDEH